MNNQKYNLIPWMQPYISGKEQDFVQDALASTWLSGGKYIDTLESLMGEFLNVKHAMTCANGTAALHLAFLALNIQEGDEVILPSFGFMAAANVLKHLKATPIFVDINPGTWCLSIQDLSKILNERTKAIVVVHPLGNLCEMNHILSLAKQYNVPIIEDAAEGFPSRYQNKVAGSMGLIGTFSFQATKTIATGEGGMIVTNDSEIAEKIKLYKSHGMMRKKHYWHELPGLNYRLTNIQAAIGCAQFEALETIIEMRNSMYQNYCNYLNNKDGISMQIISSNVSAVIWAVGLVLDPNFYPQGRDEVMKEMLHKRIETRPGFYTPYALGYFGCSEMAVSENISSHVIMLPSWPGLSKNKIKYICESLLSLRNK